MPDSHTTCEILRNYFIITALIKIIKSEHKRVKYPTGIKRGLNLTRTWVSFVTSRGYDPVPSEVIEVYGQRMPATPSLLRGTVAIQTERSLLPILVAVRYVDLQERYLKQNFTRRRESLRPVVSSPAAYSRKRFRFRSAKWPPGCFCWRRLRL